MKHIAVLALCALLLGAAFCVRAEASQNLSFAVVCNPNPADRLNLRVKPTTEAISLGKFYNGTPVTVYQIQDEWAYVSLYKDFEGWMHTDYLAFVEDIWDVPSAMPVVTVTAPGGKTVHDTMMENPSVSIPFMLGAQLEVMGVMEDWLFVRSGESIIGFTKNSGITPRVYFSAPETTPHARIPLILTPTPAPAPDAEYELVSVPVEGARNVTKDDWIIFAAMSETTPLYADRALTLPIDLLNQGQFIRIFNSADQYATVVQEDRIAGYIPRLTYTIHCTQWPFALDRPCAAVANPIPSDRLHLRAQASQSAKSLGRYYNGTIITLLEDYDGKKTWMAVEICGQTGYMKSEYLDFSPDIRSGVSSLSLYEVHNQTTGKLNLRQKPDTASESLGLYENGTLVAVIGVTGDWAHVICGGQTGFMLHKHLYTSIGTAFDPY